MSSHQLAIAKASFSAGLLRPDPLSISRDEISHFHTLLDYMTTECSRTNIQKCKQWILNNVTQSTARITGLEKYLTAFSTSFTEPGKSSTAKFVERQPSAKRKRLYLLYLINDLLHHAKFCSNDASLLSKIQPSLVKLFSNAASFRNAPKHQQKLRSLLNIWGDKQYYSADFIDKLREAATLAQEGGESSDVSSQTDRKGEVDSVTRYNRNIPFVMPATHGDQGTPWYDLPAANLMPHITPNSSKPINPELVKPLRFTAGPANESLANAVRNFLREVDDTSGTIQSHDHDQELLWDVNELGQLLLQNEIIEGTLSGKEYYGWSTVFCEKMKSRRKGLDNPHNAGYRDDQRRGRSRSRSCSRSTTSNGSTQPYKRRRYNDSDRSSSRTRSRSMSRCRQRTRSSSRSDSEERNIDAQGDISAETTLRSQSHGRGTHSARERLHSSPVQSLLPMQKSIALSRGGFTELSQASNMYGQDSQNLSQPQHSFLPAISDSSNANIIPIPLPPPPQYQGIWPPPPAQPMVPYGQRGGQWPSTPHGQAQAGENIWHQIMQQGSSRSGSYESQRRGDSTVPQQQYSSEVSGYNGYPGNGRGRGRAK